jgi:hypothetical protein
MSIEHNRGPQSERLKVLLTEREDVFDFELLACFAPGFQT